MEIIKLSNKQIFDIRISLLKLAGSTLDIVTAFKLRKFIKAITGEIKDLSDTHIELLKRHGAIKLGKPGEESYHLSEDDERYPDFKKEWDEVLSEETDLPSVKIKLEDLQVVIEEPEGDKPAKRRNILTNMDIANLDFLITE